MDQILQVKEALAARARETTLEELRSQGRRKVRIVRADQIATMIQEAVERTVRESGLLSQEDVDALVAKSREEFKDAYAGRQAEQQELEQLRNENVELRAALGFAAPAEGEEGATGTGASPGLVMQMMQEIANLRAQQGGGGAAAGGSDVQGTLDQIAANLNERLDKLGRKMGISSAVEASEVRFDSLFDDEIEANMESNIDSVKIKTKKGGGIAANLERLKKLKGGE